MSNQSVTSVSLPSGQPRQPVAKKFDLTFTTAQLSQTLLISGQSTGDSLTPQTAIVDNTTNQYGVILTIDGVNYPVPAGACSTFPVISSDYPRVSAVSSGSGSTTIVLTNQRMPSSPSNNGVVSITGELPEGTNVIGGVTINGPIPAGGNLIGIVNNNPVANLKTMADYSGTIATASTSQVAVAAGKITQFLFIQNLGSTPLYVNFGAAATAGQGSILIAQNDSLIFNPDFVPSGSINVLSATASAPYTIKGY